MQKRTAAFLALVLGTVSAGGGGGGGVQVRWCAGPLGDLFPGRPVRLGAPLPASAGALRPLRVSVWDAGTGGEVGFLDQLPGASDRPAGNVGVGERRTLFLSSRGRTVLFAVDERGDRYRAFRWPAGTVPAAVTVTLNLGSVQLNVPASALPCRTPPR